MKYNRNVYESFIMIMQFGINMIVPILLCTFIGVYLGDKFDIKIIVVPLFLMGALAGFRNIYKMAKRVFKQESDRDTKDVKKIK